MHSRIGYVLTIAAMVVAAPRYAGVMAHAAGFSLAGAAWQWIEVGSGLGFAVLEAVAVMTATRAWSDAPEGRTRNALGLLIVATLALLAGMVTPYVFATASRGVTVAGVLSVTGLWLWSLAVAVSPVVVMALAGITDHVTRRHARVTASRNARDGVFTL
jgi:hypothetical protein